MDLGIALPNAVPSTSGAELTEWADTVKQYMTAYEQAGCAELIFCPSAGDPAQVDLLADAAGL
jgi:hypothetical protein